MRQDCNLASCSWLARGHTVTAAGLKILTAGWIPQHAAASSWSMPARLRESAAGGRRSGNAVTSDISPLSGGDLQQQRQQQQQLRKGEAHEADLVASRRQRVAV